MLSFNFFTKSTKNNSNTFLSPLQSLSNGIADLVGTRKIEAIGSKVLDSLEVGIADRGAQVTIDPISGMNDPGITIACSTDRNVTTPINMDIMVTTNSLPMATTDRSVSRL